VNNNIVLISAAINRTRSKNTYRSHVETGLLRTCLNNNISARIIIFVAICLVRLVSTQL